MDRLFENINQNISSVWGQPTSGVSASSVIRDIKCNYNEHNNRLGICGADLFDIGDY